MTLINEGSWDRVIRMFAGIALWLAALVAWPETVNLLSRAGLPSLVFLGIGAIALVTGLTGWCPLYSLLHVSTKRRTAA